MKDGKNGIIINGQIINNIRCANYTVILADITNKLQKLIDKANTACIIEELKIYLSRAKFMVIEDERENFRTSMILKIYH